MIGVEPRPQLLQAALQTTVHRRHRDTEPGRDSPRRQPVEEAQQHRQAIRLLELHHHRRQPLLLLGALQRVLFGHRQIDFRQRLAPATGPLFAPARGEQVLHHRGQPRAPARWRRRLPQRDCTSVLHQIVGDIGVAGEPPRQRAQPRQIVE
jgi:hypothetical protein